MFNLRTDNQLQHCSSQLHVGAYALCFMCILLCCATFFSNTFENKSLDLYDKFLLFYLNMSFKICDSRSQIDFNIASFLLHLQLSFVRLILNMLRLYMTIGCNNIFRLWTELSLSHRISKTVGFCLVCLFFDWI